MDIRQAELSDKKDILKLVENLYGKSSPKSLKNWEKNYEKLMRLLIISEEDKKIIGFITYEFERNAIYIGDLYILPKYRRNKTATRLIEKVDSIKKKLKKKYLRVDVRKKDGSAFKLYNKLGFKIWKPKNEGSLKLRR